MWGRTSINNNCSEFSVHKIGVFLHRSCSLKSHIKGKSQVDFGPWKMPPKSRMYLDDSKTKAACCHLLYVLFDTQFSINNATPLLLYPPSRYSALLDPICLLYPWASFTHNHWYWGDTLRRYALRILIFVPRECYNLKKETSRQTYKCKLSVLNMALYYNLSH